MSKHTPGPWHVKRDNGIYAKDRYIGLSLEGHLYGSDLPCETNARLMAAAPELLEALKELYNASLVMEQPRFYKALAEAKKLIAKIEGNESNT
jgi:hypothetical protein